MVILYHTTWQLFPAGSKIPWPDLNFLNAFYLEGSSGVSLFIVMSGFLMTMIYEINPGIRYRDFIYNRFLRVIPLTALFFLGSLAVYQKEIVAASNEVINFLTLQYNSDHRFAVAPIWTVAVEFQFYLLFPILFALKQKRGMATLFGMCAVLAVFRFLLITKATIASQTFAYDVAYVTLIGRLDQFVAGMLLYEVYAARKSLTSWVHLPVSLIVVGIFIYFHRHLAFGLTTFWPTVMKTCILTIEGAVWAYFIYGILTFTINLPFQKFLAWLGQASFSMYLWHWLILEAYIHYFAPSYKYLLSTGLIVLCLTTIVSLGSFRWIEKAFLEFKRRYT